MLAADPARPDEFPLSCAIAYKARVVSSVTPFMRLPRWVISNTPQLGNIDELKRRLRRGRLVTVCEEARCPNIGECFASGTATFMLLGDTCTRRCSFCSVATGRPAPPDAGEPARIAETAEALGLRYVVVTTVARDDLEDEGASQFAATIAALKQRIAGVQVEVLTSDFNGRRELVERVLAAGPEVFGHNLETVRRLTPQVRGRARYERSLDVLRAAAQIAGRNGCGAIKSGLMAGLGETRQELSAALRDIRDTGCTLVTIGQYLRPGRHQQPVARYLEPAEFDELAGEARALGFAQVASGPLVRSSYRADRMLAAAAEAQRQR